MAISSGTQIGGRLITERTYRGFRRQFLENCNMNGEIISVSSNWLWGSIWVVYAYFYGAYFSRVASGLKPDLAYVHFPGSPERLRNRRMWCYRFANFMLIPTVLEAIRPSVFTTSIISIMPCVFGIWVMRAVWVEVLHSKVPNSSKIPQRK